MWRVKMQINTSELAAVIATIVSRITSETNRDTKELAALRERVLKLEHKTNELMDLLTDFRVNQIMSVTEKPE